MLTGRYSPVPDSVTALIYVAGRGENPRLGEARVLTRSGSEKG